MSTRIPFDQLHDVSWAKIGEAFVDDFDCSVKSTSTVSSIMQSMVIMLRRGTNRVEWFRKTWYEPTSSGVQRGCTTRVELLLTHLIDC